MQAQQDGQVARETKPSQRTRHLVIHFLELELRGLEAGHGPPPRERLDVIAQGLHLRVVLQEKKEKEKKSQLVEFSVL